MLGGIINLPRGASHTIVFQLKERICLLLSKPTHFNGHIRPPAAFTRLCLSVAAKIGTGILTRLPSASPLGLSLGPDSPQADYHGLGTLSLAAIRFLVLFIVTHAYICFS